MSELPSFLIPCPKPTCEPVSTLYQIASLIGISGTIQGCAAMQAATAPITDSKNGNDGQTPTLHRVLKILVTLDGILTILVLLLGLAVGHLLTKQETRSMIVVGCPLGVPSTLCPEADKAP